MAHRTRSHALPVSQARAAVPGTHSVSLFRHGTLEVKLSSPLAPNEQTPCTEDDLYIAVQGRGYLREVSKWVLIVGLNLTVVNVATSIKPIDGPKREPAAASPEEIERRERESAEKAERSKRAMPAQSEAQPLPTGIIEGSGDVSFPGNINIENRWHGIINGRDIEVFAGGQFLQGAGVYGIAIIEKRSGSPDHRSVRSVESTNPLSVGPLRILSAEGPVLTLQSRQGSKYLLNVEWSPSLVPLDMRFFCSRDYPGFISEGSSGARFPYDESERFGFCLDETKYPLKNLDTGDCRSIFRTVPSWSLNGPGHYPIGFEITGPGSCVVRNGPFHVQIEGSGFAEPESRLRPRIRIDEPRYIRTLKPGDPLSIKWQVTKRPNHPKNWEIDVDLVNCGAGNRRLYSGTLSKDPGKLEWIASAAEVTDPMETSWMIRVCLYDRKSGSDELRAMAMNCKAAPTDNWLVCAYGSGSARVVPK